MEGFGPIALFVLWVVISLLGRAAQGKKKGERPAPRPAPERAERHTSRTAQPSTFEELLAEMRGELERAKEMEEAEPAGHEPWQRELEGTEEFEEPESLETEPEIVSLEVEPYRPERPVHVSQSDAMQVLVQQRIAAAELRNRGWRLEDHRKFDQSIRKVKRPVAQLAVGKVSLRQAMIWSEILGPPVALRAAAPGDRRA
jgi:hypothetical protein